ncbi:dihydroxyacetone kinase subunit L [Nitratireductor aquimarinus]|uniref:dihydroxyacetone kinase subunit L n=1 Tax=Nitratireductor TaxID=245876 RepID=UPI0019D3FB83|nr:MULTISPECIES: dihydroxyacetone kinase subunit L [Nitratireductor]MBN7776536.1 dihydroxyacetone kinase subunit L [Nitratireductor pacificus]MBN7779403.1 dihydroxyacetone kinase subunit L [Nitratireductor pacificus]MBN7788210.1 dihydroxyacetone kinase subunit L [Nitratireductor aquimarinus]MBY6098257.1 dihydroxyacetone kinase subunit L [Nitratireductor aquimarinus]MCA1259236.1 dihydroxyacetone kinase subunit L [Nitratireductor aquimarinus]
MPITSSELKAALARIADHARENRDFLCEADAQLGDGDLGITVAEGFAACAKLDLNEDAGRAFFEMAKTFQQASSSSFGTLVSTGMMAAAKTLRDRKEFEADEIAGLLAQARDAMLARGKSSLGEKTVLDGLDAQARALEATQSGALIDVALKAAKDTVEEFTQKPNQAGRARIFAEKSIGLPDPGQLALVVITEGLR